jgi:hypothetical protein
MDPAVKFPSDTERRDAEAAMWRDLSPEARIQALVDLSALCDALIAASPHRDRQLELLEENERAEQEAWRALIRGHEHREKQRGPAGAP